MCVLISQPRRVLVGRLTSLTMWGEPFLCDLQGALLCIYSWEALLDFESEETVVSLSFIWTGLAPPNPPAAAPILECLPVGDKLQLLSLGSVCLLPHLGMHIFLTDLWTTHWIFLPHRPCCSFASAQASFGGWKPRNTVFGNLRTLVFRQREEGRLPGSLYLAWCQICSP